MYKEWAQAHIDKVRNILYTAKENHMNAVRGRIDDVGQLGGVIDITKNLFEVSKVCPIFLSHSFLRLQLDRNIEPFTPPQ